MDSSQPAARSGGVVGILAFGGIVAAITQTLVVPLIGELPTLFDTTASNASWVVTATLLAAAVITPSPAASVTCTARSACFWPPWSR